MKAIKKNQLTIAEFLIKNGSDVYSVNAKGFCSLDYIFGKNIIRLKKVIKEYFSAKKYKEIETKYSQRKAFLKSRILATEKLSENSFLGSNKDLAGNNLVNHNTPDNSYLITSNDPIFKRNGTSASRINSISTFKEKNGSEDVLTTNTACDKNKIPCINEEIFQDSEIELKPEITEKITSNNSTAHFKEKISFYLEEIKTTNELIKTVQEVT